jgi:hypothetical protein
MVNKACLGRMMVTLLECNSDNICVQAPDAALGCGG